MTDPTLENQNRTSNNESDRYWRENYTSRPYYQDLQRDIPDIDYDKDLSSAYKFGRNSRSEYGENTVLKTRKMILKANGNSLRRTLA